MYQHHRSIGFVLWFAAIGMAPVSLAQGSQVIIFDSKLSAMAEVPPNNSRASGMLQATLDRKKNILRWRLKSVGLSAPATGAHFHGPAPTGENATIALTIDAIAETGEANLNAKQAKQIMGGKWYVNMHTANYPDGEIRGQFF